MDNNMNALSAYATNGATNLTEAVNYYNGLKNLLEQDDSREWYQSDKANQFGDHEYYATASKLNSIRNQYFESLIHNKAPREAFKQWLAPSPVAQAPTAGPVINAPQAKDGDERSE